MIEKREHICSRCGKVYYNYNDYSEEEEKDLICFREKCFERRYTKDNK